MKISSLTLLRNDLLTAGFRVSEVRRRLGAAADDARERGVFVPATRALNSGERGVLEAQIELLLLGHTCTSAEIDAAFPQLGVDLALELGIIRPDTNGGYRAALSLNPVALTDPRPDHIGESVDLWVLSDLDDGLRQGPARADHVMGVGSATCSLLAQAPMFRANPSTNDTVTGKRISYALDVGTGCGIIALVLAVAGVPRIVATDTSARALAFARANAHLNALTASAEFDFREGSLFEPVEGEQFDLILSNPPFVITPRDDGSVPVYDYRDGKMTGDQLAQTVIEQSAAHLSAGGELVCLANWEYPWGVNGFDRVREWIDRASHTAGGPSELIAWVIERDQVEPIRYAETWIRDGGTRPADVEFATLMDAWLRDFAQRRIVAIGLGIIRLRRLTPAPAGASERGGADGGASHSVTEGIRAEYSPVRAEQVTGVFAETPGYEMAQIFAAGDEVERMPDAELLERYWVRQPGVEERRVHEPGEEGPRAITLHIHSPVERIATADPLLAAAVGACDGELTLRQISDALATLLDVEAVGVGEALCLGVRELVWLGMLRDGTPASPVD